MTERFSRVELGDFQELQSREWLETNGLGGWASAPFSGAHSRRYHGLLVAAVTPPTRRMLLVSKLEEVITHGNQRFELSANQYPGAVHPQGHEYLREARRDLFPSFIFEAGRIRLQKTIAALHGENTTLVLYEVLEAPGEFTLQLTPLIAGRGYHELRRRNPDFNENCERISSDSIAMKPYSATPQFFIRVCKAAFESDPQWYYRFEYLRERQRGYDFEEDLFSPGHFAAALKPFDKLGVIVSLDNPESRSPFALLQQEQQRRALVIANAPAADPVASALHLAADQFIVRTASERKTILAGYHWFTDWGRDAMIALPGICLVPKRFSEARQILLSFTERMSRGMLPNNSSDDSSPAGYNTIDATLWYFVALYRYYLYSKDLSLIEDLLPVLHDIMDWHVRGTRYDIHVDQDGLLMGGNPTVQLTWMDAKIDDWVVTPRSGKPVEINALWYNALKICEFFSILLNQRNDAEDFAARARVVHARFNEVYWNGEVECLFDCIADGNRDSRIRPNQIFALSLPFPLLDAEQALKVLRVVESKLYTPFGLRTLDPEHPGYVGRCAGTQRTRDAAYHQGTAWSWLLGPYVTALVRFDKSSGLERARRVVERFVPHFRTAGVGTISEIFDGDAPHHPRGAIAQAWGVAEMLRAYTEDILGEGPERS